MHLFNLADARPAPGPADAALMQPSPLPSRRGRVPRDLESRYPTLMGLTVISITRGIGGARVTTVRDDASGRRRQYRRIEFAGETWWEVL